VGDLNERREILLVTPNGETKPLVAEDAMTTEPDLAALCHEFTDALTDGLAENAVGMARRGRVARAHAAIKRHPD